MAYVTESSSPELNGKTGAFTVTKPSAEQSRAGSRRQHVSFRLRRRHALPGTGHDVLRLDSPGRQPAGADAEDARGVAVQQAPHVRFSQAVRLEHQRAAPLSVRQACRRRTGISPGSIRNSSSTSNSAFSTCRKLGIEADMILFHPYDEGHWGFDRMPADADDRYLRYVVARLAAYRNVWWSLANEWDFMKEKEGIGLRPLWRRSFRTTTRIIICSRFTTARKFSTTRCRGSRTRASRTARRWRNRGARSFIATSISKPVVYDEVKYEGNIPQRWGDLSAEEMVFRFWNGTVAGTYVGHGETYMSPTTCFGGRRAVCSKAKARRGWRF